MCCLCLLVFGSPFVGSFVGVLGSVALLLCCSLVILQTFYCDTTGSGDKADYDDGDTLETAFDGFETLLLISYASVEHHHRTAVCC